LNFIIYPIRFELSANDIPMMGFSSNKSLLVAEYQRDVMHDSWVWRKVTKKAAKRGNVRRPRSEWHFYDKRHMTKTAVSS